MYSPTNSPVSFLQLILDHSALTSITNAREGSYKGSYSHDCRANNAPYRHDRRADKNPYQHDRNMRFSSKLNYALFSILMVRLFFLELSFIAVGWKHLRFNECIT